MFLINALYSLTLRMKTISAFDSHMEQAGYGRLPLLKQISPLVHLRQLSKRTGTDIFMKRDDLTELGLGGNKLRKLEYLLAEAKKQGANRIITVGARQSNHARLTAVAARMAGFTVDLVLKNAVPQDTEDYQLNGNIVLDNIVDARIHEIPNDGTASAYISSLINHYEEAGDQVYFIPVGGSNKVGGFGYARAAYELVEQCRFLDLDFTQIALATGSGGTHAGLLAGYHLQDRADVRIQAYNVQIDREPLLTETQTIYQQILAECAEGTKADMGSIQVSNAYVGEQYGIPSPETLETIKLLAQTEGIFLDPVYTGKAFAGMLGDIKKGQVTAGEPILFLHTGGIPGIFAYSNWF